MTPSKFASAKYPNLYKLPGSKNWRFRKYVEGRGEFNRSTGEPKSESRAFSVGQQMFHEWLGLKESGVKEVRFGDYAQETLNRKLELPDSDFAPNSKRSLANSVRHLIEAFGHLRVDQVDENRWEAYYSEEYRKNPEQKFFNRRKALIEIARRAQRDGLIKRLPEFKNPDPQTDAGQYLKDDLVERILDRASPDIELLGWIMWKQGARPGEVLQYRWDMIAWDEGQHGAIHIPASITKTRRARTIPLNSEVAARLKERQAHALGPWVFPSPVVPEKPMVEFGAGWKRACRREACDRLCRDDKAPAPRPGQPGPRKCVGLCRQVELPTIYDLRRSFLTNQAKRGVPVLYLAKYVDSSISMIERFYAKVNLDVFGGITS